MAERDAEADLKRCRAVIELRGSTIDGPGVLALMADFWINRAQSLAAEAERLKAILRKAGGNLPHESDCKIDSWADRKSCTCILKEIDEALKETP